MNIYQRIVLIVGAIALIIAILTAPGLKSYGDHNKRRVYTVRFGSDGFIRSSYDVRAVVSRSLIVVIPTLLIWWALKGVDKK